MGALFAGLKDIVKSLPWKTWLGIFVVGWLFGWFVFGWGIAPVKWTNAAPQHLEPSWRADYLRMVIESYIYNGNVPLAQTRYQGLGDDGPKVLAQVEQDPGYLRPEDVARFKQEVVGGAPATGAPAEGAAAQQGGRSWTALFGLCLVVLVGLAAVGLLFMVRKKAGTAKTAETAVEVQPLIAEGGPAPISSYRTTYTLGDDYFDESFSIDTAGGEFLGEAGLSISEASEGQPKHVQAFEVWLFDKSDIRTETAIFCTPEAYANEAMRQRLEAKGPVLAAAPGQSLTLETEKLQLEAFITECEFDADDAGQFFQKLTVEFRVYQRVPAEDEGPLTAAGGDLPA